MPVLNRTVSIPFNYNLHKNRYFRDFPPSWKRSIHPGTNCQCFNSIRYLQYLVLTKNRYKDRYFPDIPIQFPMKWGEE